MKKTLRQICAEQNLSRRTIQGYEKWGLVQPSGRNKYGHLLYNATAQERIQTIRFYQQIGFSLKEICSLLDAPNENKREALRKQVEQMEQQQEQLRQLIDRAKQQMKLL